MSSSSDDIQSATEELFGQCGWWRHSMSVRDFVIIGEEEELNMMSNQR